MVMDYGHRDYAQIKEGDRVILKSDALPYVKYVIGMFINLKTARSCLDVSWERIIHWRLFWRILRRNQVELSPRSRPC